MEPSEEAVKAALLKWWLVNSIEEAGPNGVGGRWDDRFVVSILQEMREALKEAYAIDGVAR